MPSKLYISSGSPPVRAVQMCIGALDLKIDFHELNLLNNEHKTSDFKLINPQCTVPTLDEGDGFVLWDSHAIMAYLVGKYAKNDRLCPKDLKKRAILDQRLHFECGVLFPPILQMLHDIVQKGKKTLDVEQINWFAEMYDVLERFLKGRRFMNGDEITIADYSIMSSVSSMETMIPIDPNTFPKLNKWFKTMEDLKEYSATKASLEATTAFVKSLMEG